MSAIYIITALFITILVCAAWWYLPRVVYMLATGYYGVTFRFKAATVSALTAVAILELYFMAGMWWSVFHNVKDVIL